MTIHTKRSSSGFTIVEIMIALALGVLLSAALVQIFTSTHTLSAMETSLSRVQETGRFAMEAIAKDIRMAGYQGCADPNDLELIIIAKKFQGGEFAADAIRGYEVSAGGTFTPTLDAASDLAKNVQGKTRPGSDVIVLGYANETGITLADPTANSANITVSQIPTMLQQDDFALLSDCKSAHLFQITNNPNNTTVTHGGNWNDPHNKLTPGYQTGAHLLTFERRAYYVADTGRKSNSGATIYSLFVRDQRGNSQEILEGVEALQILYGQQLLDGKLRYLKANDVTNWNQVVSVRLGMLVQSFEQVADQNDTNTYHLPGASISHNSTPLAHAGDRSLRKAFTTTVKLRNRRQKI